MGVYFCICVDICVCMYVCASVCMVICKYAYLIYMLPIYIFKLNIYNNICIVYKFEYYIVTKLFLCYI